MLILMYCCFLVKIVVVGQVEREPLVGTFTPNRDENAQLHVVLGIDSLCRVFTVDLSRQPILQGTNEVFREELVLLEWPRQRY